MDPSDTVRRILARRWWVVFLCVLIGVGGALAVAAREGTWFTGSVRLVLDTPDPKNVNEATAIADLVRAIATSPERMQAALDAIGSGRDAVEVATRRVTVESMGSSGVLRLSVRDPDAAHAVELANALAAVVIKTRQDVSTGGVAAALAAIDRDINATERAKASADAAIASMSSRIAAAPNAADAATIRLALAEAQRDRESLAGKLDALWAERGHLTSSQAQRPKASIIQPAQPPAGPDPTRTTPAVALGILAGLLAGAGIAATIEIVRPVVAGADAVARAFGAPVLQEIRGSDRTGGLADAVERIRIGAAGAKVGTVVITPVGSSAATAALSAELEAMLTTKADEAAEDARSNGGGHTRGNPRDGIVRAGRFLPHGPRERDGVQGFVFVSPAVASRAAVDQAVTLASIARCPALGVVVYRPNRSRTARAVPAPPIEER